MYKKASVLALSFFLVLVLAGCGKKNVDNQSQGGDRIQNQGKEQSKGAPTELISACEGKSEGDTCEASMSAPKNNDNQSENAKSNGKLSGTCKKTQDGSQLACMPQGGAGGPRGQKPDTSK